MKKVLVIGSGGAGKTTFARHLAARTGLPLIHLDRLHWSAGWVPMPDDAWDAMVDELIRRDTWVMDGNYGRTLPRRMAAADTIVFLDLPRLVCIGRVLARQLQHRGASRPELPEGCPERFSWEFLKWIWTYPRRRRPEILRRLEELKASKRVVILRSASQVRRFLEAVETPVEQPGPA